jgi:hypothetical protein
MGPMAPPPSLGGMAPPPALGPGMGAPPAPMPPQQPLSTDFILGLLSGAGIPVLARALRPGRTEGERDAMDLSPAQLIAQLQPMLEETPPKPRPTLMDILPALAAARGPGFQGIRPGGLPTPPIGMPA